MKNNEQRCSCPLPQLALVAGYSADLGDEGQKGYYLSNQDKIQVRCNQIIRTEVKSQGTQTGKKQSLPCTVNPVRTCRRSKVQFGPKTATRHSALIFWQQIIRSS